MASRVTLTTSLLLATLAIAGACASIDDSDSGSGPPCQGIGCQAVDAGRDQFTADVVVPDAPLSDSGPSSSNPLCGTGCNPDEAAACGASASTVDAGADAAPKVDDAGDAGATMGCFVTPAAAAPSAACMPAGTGASGAPCVSASDCAPGFACVGDANAAQCRRYCCSSDTKCDDGSYCAERSLREATASGAKVPVCVQADNCELSEPYPCPANKQCTCKEGTACAVVLPDGTTSCVVPGTGRAGESCPCAPGHVCAKSTNSCLKLCTTQGSTSGCGSGKCQSAAYLPDGYGVCVLTAPDGG
ncbi:MAG: hypothetical protein R3B13_01170 [Polyangiaceae bacterium]